MTLSTFIGAGIVVVILLFAIMTVLLVLTERGKKNE